MGAILIAFTFGIAVGVGLLAIVVKRAIENEVGRWFGWCLLICIIAAPLFAQTASQHAAKFGLGIGFAFLFACFAIVMAVALRNTPRNRAGWAILAVLTGLLALSITTAADAQIQSQRLPGVAFDVDRLTEVIARRKVGQPAPQIARIAALAVTSAPARIRPSLPPVAPPIVRSGLSGHAGDGVMRVTINPNAAVSGSDEIVAGRIVVRAWIWQLANGVELWCLVPLSVSVSTSPQVFTVTVPKGGTLFFEHRPWMTVRTSAWKSDESVGVARFLRPATVWVGRIRCL